jgi:hypothetical protein
MGAQTWTRMTVAPCCLLMAPSLTKAITAQPADAIAVLHLYVSQLRWASAQFPFTPDATSDQIRGHFSTAEFVARPTANSGDG